MPYQWQCCPHCKVHFVPREGAPPNLCPMCAQPVAGKPSDPIVLFDFDSLHQVLSEAQVVPEAANCVQCGMCSFNCPMGIDVRAHAWRGKPIRDGFCLTCTQCVQRCPRGVLRLERIPLFSAK